MFHQKEAVEKIKIFLEDGRVHGIFCLQSLIKLGNSAVWTKSLIDELQVPILFYKIYPSPR